MAGAAIRPRCGPYWLIAVQVVVMVGGGGGRHQAEVWAVLVDCCTGRGEGWWWRGPPSGRGVGRIG